MSESGLRPATRAEPPARPSALVAFLRAPLRVWAWRLFPYAGAAAVIAFILSRYSFDAIYAEAAKGNTLPLIPISLCTLVMSLLFVTAADTVVLRGLLGPGQVPTYFAIARGKAAAVLLHIVHYALGQGAYATWLARKTGLGIGRVSGILLFFVAAELCSVCLYATTVFAIGRPNVPKVIPITAVVLSVTLIAVILTLPALRGALGRFVVLQAWTDGSRVRGIAQLGIRMVQHTTTTLGTWFASQAFGLDIPLFVMLSYVPVILIVSSLPINVAGFGAVQGAWLLLSPWADAERILAFSVVWQLISCLALILRGLPFVSIVMNEVRAGRAPAPAVSSAPPARP